MEKKELILSYIQDELIDDEEIEIREDTSLFQDRILDSLNLVSLLSFLEKTFKIKIATSEVNFENLDTVSNMLVFLETKSAP